MAGLLILANITGGSMKFPWAILALARTYSTCEYIATTGMQHAGLPARQGTNQARKPKTRTVPEPGR